MSNFEFQLVLTKQCNLRCTYCYMNKSSYSMTKEVFDKHYIALDHFLMKYGSDTYTAALFGGEPLLNWELLEYVVPIFKNDTRCKQIIAMTNGLVLSDLAKRKYIQDNGIDISLSFDGLWNNENRPLADGSPSLPSYVALKDYFSSLNSCKVMVAPESASTLVENYMWFVEEYGIQNPDFSLVRDDIWTDDDIKLMEEKVPLLGDQMIRYIRRGIPTMVGFFKLYMLDLIFGKQFGKRDFSCFAGCRGAGFMPDGLVYPCARFGDKKAYPLFDSINFKESVEPNQLFSNPKVIDPRTFEYCQGCDLYQYCNTGCLNQQLRTDGSVYYSQPVDSICMLLKILYKESMRISHELRDNMFFLDMLRSAIQNVG